MISSEERNTCRQARSQRLVKAATELNALLEQRRRQATRKPPAREKLLARAQKIVDQRKVGELVQVSVRTVQGEPELTWELDAAALAAAERLDGYYVLLCSWPAAQADVSTLLRRWKQQWLVERRFHDWKWPLRVRPVFVTSPKRIAAFMLLLHLALMLFCLIEREARRALAQKAETKVRNLLAGHVDAIPTGANILLAFDHLFLLIEEGPPPENDVSEMLPVQQDLWRLLGARMPSWA